MSAFFPRVPAGDFAPLFRLLDDYDVHRSTSSPAGRDTTSFVRSFQPRFDVREQKDAFELQGELPGIEQKDIQIEFTDHSTIVIKGHTERHSERGSGDSGRITGADEGQDGSYHKPTIEDENSEEKNNDQQVAKSGKDKGDKKSDEPRYKYWVSERSVGEFHRSFTFPTRVDPDKVKAGLKNGILTITVPKASAPQARQIKIE